MKHLACLYKHVTFYQKSLFSFVMDFRDSKLGTLSGGCLNYGRLYYPDNLLQIQRERRPIVFAIHITYTQNGSL